MTELKITPDLIDHTFCKYASYVT